MKKYLKLVNGNAFSEPGIGIIKYVLLLSKIYLAIIYYYTTTKFLI